ncbi:YceD family protein [Companilactobacillus sp. HBUAS59699]|uniref:YceD family protein n=1 Tax=Companilactobacillus sp. HBUAS59699 TaxID=3109358 RepID=UPI002FF0F2AC
MLNWDVQDVRKYKDKPFAFNENLDLEKELQGRSEDIITAGTAKVDGQLFNDNGLVISDVKVEISVTLPSTRSLDPVELPMKFRINEAYNIDNIDTEELDENTVIIPIDDDNPTIDVYKSIIDNILLNIPSQILTEDEANGKNMPSGKNWEVISEDDYQKQKEDDKQVNPEFAKLKNLFKDNKEKE